MPTIPASPLQQKSETFQLHPSDSFAMHIAMEILKKKGWLKYPEKHLKKIERTVWEYRNKRFEYKFLFRVYSKRDFENRVFNITLSFSEALDGVEGMFEAASSSPREKIKGDCSAVIEENGDLSAICLNTDRESIFN